MEEVINKPEEQFQDVLNDLIDFDKNSEEKSALIEEVCRKASKQIAKPAASLSSSIYSSAASSSSSTSSASESSTNSASSSSTSSTLSSPSQSNQSNGEAKESRIMEIIEDYDNLEMPKMEDLGKTARILEHISGENTITANDTAIYAAASHSDRRSTNIYNSTRLSSLASQTTAYKLTQLNQKANLIQHSIDNTNNTVTSNMDPSTDSANLTNSWKTMSGKRDKRRRKPAEQPVLSQHIPGHKGEQELDWLVKFIESGPSTASGTNTNSTKKAYNNNKNTKPHPKRQAAQPSDLDRENQQRKTNTSGCKSASTQSRPLLPSNKSTPSSQQIASMSQAQQSDQRKVQPTPNNIQVIKQQSSSQERACDRVSDRKEPSQKPVASQVKRSLEQKKDISEDDDAVTFADHIRVTDDDDIGQRYVFGFFEYQRQQTNQVKPTKSSPKHNEKSTTNNNIKTIQVGQKHKMKHPKASPNSEQKRYKCTDNIDASSFNYHQILEFISNSWESTAKSHRQIVKHTSA